MKLAAKGRSTHAVLGIASLVTVGAFAAWDNLVFHFSPAAHFRKHGDSDSLWAVLKNDIRNGDPITKVEKLLGPGKRNENPKYRAACIQMAATNPDTHPDGFDEGDELLGYRTGTLWIHLQVRDGHLVNFNPDDYPVEFQLLGSG